MIEHRPLSSLGGDDQISPGTGFPMHFHRDIEIVTYVREGAISHQDSLGNSGRTVAGDVQVMSAGSGIRHAEFNAEPGTTRMFQIWLETRNRGSTPRWATRTFPKADRSGAFAVLASGRPETPGLPIDADAEVLGATVRDGETVAVALADGQAAYLVPSTGRIVVNGVELAAGDGAAIRDEPMFHITAIDDTEIVLVTLF